MIRLPEVDVQNTIRHRDIPLLKTFAPAIRILAGDVVEQCVPVPFAQFLLELHGGAAAQFPIVNHHVGFDAEHVLTQPGKGAVNIGSKVAAVIQKFLLLLDVLPDARLVLGQVMPVQFGVIVFAILTVHVFHSQFCREVRDHISFQGFFFHSPPFFNGRGPPAAGQPSLCFSPVPDLRSPLLPVRAGS